MLFVPGLAVALTGAESGDTMGEERPSPPTTNMPTNALVVCPHCQRHVRSSESQCPHCGEAVRDGKGRVVATAGAVLVGLTLGTTGCPLTVEPVYGVPTTDPEDDDDDDDDSATGDATADTSSHPSIVPEYGVPDTSETGNTSAEPDYGVPETSGD